MEGAQIVVESSIDNPGAHQLELRPVQSGNALRAAHGALPHWFVEYGQAFDQAPWSILPTDRRDAKAVWGPKVH